MSDKKAEESSSISVDTLAEALAKFVKGQQPAAELLTGLTQQQIDQAQGKLARPIRERRIPGKSRQTESTFTMIVLESRSPKHPHGRVVRLEDYRLPPKAYIRQSAGGDLPDGAMVWVDPKNQTDLNDKTPSALLTMQFKQTRTEQYWRPDLQNIASGNPLRAENCVDPKAISANPKDPGAVPWEETHLWARPSEDAAE